LPEAHVALGSVLSLFDWNWAAGEQELEKPSSWIATIPPVTSRMDSLACRERFDSALAEVERALELRSRFAVPNFILGWLYGVSARVRRSSLAAHCGPFSFAPDTDCRILLRLGLRRKECSTMPVCALHNDKSVEMPFPVRVKLAIATMAAAARKRFRTQRAERTLAILRFAVSFAAFTPD